jgi:hypothetical protein
MMGKAESAEYSGLIGLGPGVAAAVAVVANWQWRQKCYHCALVDGDKRGRTQRRQRPLILLMMRRRIAGDGVNNRNSSGDHL